MLIVWTLLCTPEQKIVWKCQSKAGQQIDEVNKERRTKHALEIAILKAVDKNKYDDIMEREATQESWVLRK